MIDHAFKLNVGRQGFWSVNPEIRIIEGQIIEVLLYIWNCEIYQYTKCFIWKVFYRASAHFYSVKIDVEWQWNHKLKIKVFIFNSLPPYLSQSLLHSCFKYKFILVISHTKLWVTKEKLHNQTTHKISSFIWYLTKDKKFIQYYPVGNIMERMLNTAVNEVNLLKTGQSFCINEFYFTNLVLALRI